MAVVWMVNPKRVSLVVISDEPGDLELVPGKTTVVLYSPDSKIGHNAPLEEVVEIFERDGYVVAKPVED